MRKKVRVKPKTEAEKREAYINEIQLLNNTITRIEAENEYYAEISAMSESMR